MPRTTMRRGVQQFVFRLRFRSRVSSARASGQSASGLRIVVRVTESRWRVASRSTAPTYRLCSLHNEFETPLSCFSNVQSLHDPLTSMPCQSWFKPWCCVFQCIVNTPTILEVFENREDLVTTCGRQFCRPGHTLVQEHPDGERGGGAGELPLRLFLRRWSLLLQRLETGLRLQGV